MAAYVKEETQLEEAIATTIAETRRYAKRQRTWLRSEPGLIEIEGTNELPVDAAREIIRSNSL